MKKIILAAACMACASVGFAQRASSSSTSFFSTEKAEKKVTLGIRGGLNIAKLKVTEDNVSATLGGRPAFNVGLNVDIAFTQSMYFQTGLFFTQKGCKDSEEEGNTKDTYKTNPGYLEIPLLASYRYNFNDNLQLQVNTGPYLAVGICGKSKDEYKYGDQKYENKYDFFGGEDDEDSEGFKRFDMGWQVGIGLTIKKFYVGYAFEAGFLNIGRDEDYNTHTRNHMINIGYNF